MPQFLINTVGAGGSAQLRVKTHADISIRITNAGIWKFTLSRQRTTVSSYSTGAPYAQQTDAIIR